MSMLTGATVCRVVLAAFYLMQDPVWEAVTAVTCAMVYEGMVVLPALVWTYNCLLCLAVSEQDLPLSQNESQQFRLEAEVSTE